MTTADGHKTIFVLVSHAKEIGIRVHAQKLFRIATAKHANTFGILAYASNKFLIKQILITLKPMRKENSMIDFLLHHLHNPPGITTIHTLERG
jgi:hypothetical protein